MFQKMIFYECITQTGKKIVKRKTTPLKKNRICFVFELDKKFRP